MTAQVKAGPRVGIKSIPKLSPSLKLSKIELAALILSLAAIGGVLGYYLKSLTPVQTQLARVQKEVDEQKSVVTVFGKEGPSQKEKVKLATDSLSAFRSGWLKPYNQGRIAAINEINGLVKSDEVHLTSGLSLAMVTNKAGSKDKVASKRKKNGEFLLDVYPRVQMTFVVLGDYKHIRKFLKDLQASKQFLVINSISIVPQDQKQGRGRVQQVVAPGGLALSVDLNAFFSPSASGMSGQ